MAQEKQTLQIDKLLQTVVNQKASDLHIASGQPPVLRLSGHMVRLERANALPAIVIRDLANGEEHAITFDETVFNTPQTITLTPWARAAGSRAAGSRAASGSPPRS